MNSTTAPIIVGVDQSDTARRAAFTAAELAASVGAPLHLVMAVSRTRSSNVTSVGSDRWHIDCVSTAQQFLDGLMRELPGTRTTRTVSLDEPATAICDEATRLNARTIVVGNRRVQGLSRMLGAVATDVARRAPCDVLIANTTCE